MVDGACRKSYIFMNEVTVNKLFFFFSTVEEVSKRIRKHVLLFLSSFRYTHESLGGLEKAVITLACHSARFSVHVVR